MKRILLVITSALLILVGCQGDPEGYKLDGTLEGLSNQELVLQYLTFQATTNIDTTTTDASGNYKFTGLANDAGYYRISAGQKFWILLLEENGKVTFNADANDAELKTHSVSGSAASETFESALNFIVSQQASVNDLVSEYQGLQGQMQQAQSDPAKMMELQTRMMEIQSILEGQDAQIKTAIKEYVAGVSEPYTGFYLLSSLDMNKDFEFVKAKVNEYAAAIPSSPYATYYQERLVQAEAQIAQQKAQEAQAQKTSIGSVAPEIVQKNPQGQDLKLSDLKGKVVLVDFWASWCKPCRFENPNVVATYNKYKNQGFTVFSVSLDKARDPWMAAIAQDGLVWNTHVSDLQFWNNAAAKLYGVSSIPAAFLIDRDGVIVGKNLRGPELEAKVKEIIG